MTPRKEIQDIIDVLNRGSAKYSVYYWTVGDEALLDEFIEDDRYLYGVVYKNADRSIAIYAFSIENEETDLEEWLTVGLTEEEVHYIHNHI